MIRLFKIQTTERESDKNYDLTGVSWVKSGERKTAIIYWLFYKNNKVIGLLNSQNKIEIINF